MSDNNYRPRKLGNKIEDDGRVKIMWRYDKKKRIYIKQENNG